MDTLQRNLQRATELLPELQDAAKAFIVRAFKEVPFTVAEVFRTQQKQDEYWFFNRDKNGRVINPRAPVKTRTRSSNHTKRRAMDIYPLAKNGTLLEGNAQRLALIRLEQIGRAYGLFRPPETMAWGDYVHFEMLPQAPEMEPPPITLDLSAEAAQKADQRALDRVVSPAVRDMIIDRMRRRAQRAGLPFSSPPSV